ncbi:S46 family peptidase [Mangrovibacterium diazotrophicum]|uniref:Dipeptidyl-peptidase n=1 Tax=Mangrovibacterium diazotrophicum TaxID=1261403 RepID=A0A419WAH6_9BACT|nr:S46 family peptidase [Mangrovibacterium diazotrophicum]RKD92475.1 peptidase S46-like protein [Mangrovibacterium diazotrophicum]
MKKLFLVVVTLGLLWQGTARADEGMWLPALIQKLNIGDMQKMGLELSADDIYNINQSSLKDAVVALDHGSCTAELVSPKGLLLTNHHCGFGEIQAHSSVEHDYLRDGFWAKSMEEELPNPGKTVSFLVRVEDVTDRVLDGVEFNAPEDERKEKIQKASFEIQKEATADNDYEARVQTMFEGNKYYLFVYETYRDVRLVGAPPASIGKFGGDTDNWMWPRHTGDFSIFRVYCSPDGKPADYSPDNVPLEPKHFLPISLDGYEDGDFAMVMGYPGRTNRYKTSFGVEYTMDVTNTVRINARGVKLAILKDYMNSSQKANIQYASKYARSSNYYKYSIGQNKGLEALDVVEKKKALEAKFTEWVDADAERTEKYGKALEMIEDSYREQRDDVASEYLMETMFRGPELFAFCMNMKGLHEALKSANNEDRVQANVERIRSRVDEFFKDYDAATDEKVAAALVDVYKKNVDPAFYPTFFADINKKYKGNAADFMAYVFGKTVFADQEKLEAFLSDPSLKVMDKDPAFQVAESIFRQATILGEIVNRTSGGLQEGRRLFVAGLMEMEKDRKFYPDANSTMRLTYGTVGDYVPRDGVKYDYYTTLKGYIEKEIPGDDEFDVPARLKDLFYAKDFGDYADENGELRTCFTTNNDITGGNSGSPVINGKGQLTGIAFDGNWEAMSGDIAFEPELQKCICVDIRFVLWTIDKFAGAKNLIDEMTLVKSDKKVEKDVASSEK